MNHSSKFFLLLLSFTAHVNTQAIDILLGHYEVQFDYDPIAGNADAGWQFSVSFDDDDNFNDSVGITRLDPSAVRLVASPGTLRMISAATSRLGSVGAPLWQIPQNNIPGQLFLGLRVVIDPGVFQTSFNGFYSPSTLGNIRLEMSSVSGSGVANGGNFAMWENQPLGGLEFHFDTSDGISAADRIEPVPIGAHTHYNWGMTRPGNYQVNFRASGKLNPWQPNGNQVTSGEASFNFVVPFSGEVTAEADLQLSDSAEIPAAIYSVGEACDYATNQVALVTAATEFGGIPIPYGFVLNLVTDALPSANRIGIAADVNVTLPTILQLQTTPLEVVDSSGPGSLTLLETVPGKILVSASESGIYRLTLRSRLLNTDTSITQLGQPFTLTLLAGLLTNYAYADYADSFERQHGLASGDLGDPSADYDGDGLPNGVEYQLFWHGFDPVLADAQLLPRPEFHNGTWTLSFLRDTYKDDLSLNASRLAAAYSNNLLTWSTWHTQNTPKPDAAVFEDGVGADSIGRIMRRRLRVNTQETEVFFRFQFF